MPTKPSRPTSRPTSRPSHNGSHGSSTGSSASIKPAIKPILAAQAANPRNQIAVHKRSLHYRPANRCAGCANATTGARSILQLYCRELLCRVQATSVCDLYRDHPAYATAGRVSATSDPRQPELDFADTSVDIDTRAQKCRQ